MAPKLVGTFVPDSDQLLFWALTMSQAMTTTGGCLCGGVRYEIEGALAPIQLCHCTQCRKAQGTAFAANIPVALSRFCLLKGRDLLREYESSPGKYRAFCSHCGSPVFSRRDSMPQVVRVRAGLLDGDLPTHPATHAWVESNANWWEIQDELPRFDKAMPTPPT
jgi:hypothetical protein